MLFYNKLLFIIKIFLIIVIFTKCGYQSSINTIQNKINNDYSSLTISLYSYDPFNSITRAIKNELYLNNINIINDNNKKYIPEIQYIPCLNIISESTKHIVTSVYQDGTESEYQLVLKIQTKLFLPKTHNYYPIDIYEFRTLIKNPEVTLPNTIQETEILEDMYQDIACKLIQKLVVLINKEKELK